MRGVSCGDNHTGAYTEEGQLYAWGWGEYGRLGLGDQELVSTPTQVRGALEDCLVVGVSCGAAHTLVLTLPGSVYAFGLNEYGQVRRRGNNHHAGPGLVAATASTLGSTSSSHQEHHVLSPIRVLDFTDDENDEEGVRPVKVSAGFGHSAVLLSNGKMFLWGFGEEGQIGLGDESSVGQPAELDLLPDGVMVFDIALGHCHTTALVSRAMPG